MPEPAVAERTTPEIVALPPDALERHPLNPRPEPKKDERLEELIESVKVHGQKQPCVLTTHGLEEGQYRIVIGHRRVQACKELGRTCLSIVEDLDDDAALAIMLSDNEVHAPVDPFLEARAVAVLLEKPGWTLQSVAEALGKGVRWVARRANLHNLRPKLRKGVEKLGWPLEWMEDLAKLSGTAQDALDTQELWGVTSRFNFDAILARSLQVLGKAPWGLDDEGLLPSAGSCAACPKTSLRAPGLFDKGEDIDNPARALRRAICRDSTCWAAKRCAWAEGQVRKALEAGQRAVTFSYAGQVRGAPEFTKALPRISTTASCEEVKRGTKGALLAIELKDDGAVGRVIYVKDPGPEDGKRKAKRARGAPAPADDPRAQAAEKLKASKERIKRRREAHVDQAVKDLILNMGPPRTEGFVFALAVALEVPAPWRPDTKSGAFLGLNPEEEEARFHEALLLTNQNIEATLWPRLRNVLARRREPWMVTALKVDLDALEADARREIPDPASWASLRVQAKGGKGHPGSPPKWWTDQQEKRRAAKGAEARRRKRKVPPVADTIDSAP